MTLAPSVPTDPSPDSEGGSAAGASLPSSVEADDRSFAIDLALRAGRLLMERYERVEQIDRKSAKDVVTEVDHLSERLIIDAIRDRCPDDGILAEESGAHHRAGRQVTSGHGRVWIVDPLDGTVNYANGIPVFCVSIGLVVDGRAAVGVVHDPTRDETYAASASTATTLNGRVVSPSNKADVGDWVVSLALSGRGAPSKARAVRKAIRVSRSMGSAALAIAYVANGRFDAMVQTSGLSAWDVAAGGLIVERAGAVVTEIDGGPWLDLGRKPQASGIVAAPAAIHAKLMALLAGA